MKLQIEDQRLRFRISEAELTRLLAGTTLCDETRLGPSERRQRHLHLQPGTDPQLDWRDGQITLYLPRTAVEDYAAGLPRRDALRFTLDCAGEAVTLDFDVDVRDSVRTRLAGKAAPD